MDKISLLIVDDERVVQRSCIDIFAEKSTRYEISTVSSGEEAELLLTCKHFDIILTDLKMPGLAGTDLISKIRTKYPDTAIIVITGFSTVQIAVEVMKLGAVDFIPKPFTPAEIFNVVENASSKLKSRGKK
jgi:DNA-binding NtrC family response regulator